MRPIVLGLLAWCLATGGDALAQTRRQAPAQKPPAQGQAAQPQSSAPASSAFPTIETQARQAFMIDFQTGTVLLDKNGDELMPPSSMSKIMTALMVYERLKRGEMALTDELPVSERAWRMGGSKMFVMVGTRVKLEDLLRGIIVQSGNDACVVVAEAIAGNEEAFAEMMTKRARELGLTKSVFKNASGWPHPEHLMTARELAMLSKYLIENFPEYYHYDSEIDFTYNGIKQGNRNPLLYRGRGADGLKTGHTDAGGYGVTASMQRSGRRVILVVNGLPSMKARESEAEMLMEWGYREFENYTLFKAGDTAQTAAVWLGGAKSVPMVAAQDLSVTLPRRARRDMKVTAVYEEPIAAPIAKGQEIGKLVVTAPGIERRELPLVASAAVDKLGPIGRIGAAVSYLIWGAAPIKQ
ncbi:MAG: D-alanyl-D-alanine carboxypeptidase [Proteobacteria bacterium]|nr:D-alanyl-D-alanine carboxypeptidase [Pseudomonadota bacterium]MBI3496083.1 D-alanyl-D-alanine carboxypeptidase [Pseudomonadota bacterium]